MAIRTEECIHNLNRLWKTVGEDADIVSIDAQDYGSQKGELISPVDFEHIYMPYYKKINKWVHENTTWKTWMHSCGSITKIIPLLIESGLDILNPIQCSSAGMDPVWLKEEFGDKLTFWGGGINTQSTLSFGTPEEVEKEVKQRIDIFAPGRWGLFLALIITSNVTLPWRI